MIAPEHLRIAIVGAGPAGLTLAYFLRRLGLRAVHLFEARDEVGGQSVTHAVDGIPVEIGTADLAQRGMLAKRIARELGCAVERLPSATILDGKGELLHPVPQRSHLLIRYGAAWLRWSLAGRRHAPSHADEAQSFAGWLDARGLGELQREPAFAAEMNARLAGPLDAVSAYSGLCRMRPALVMTGRRQQTACLPQGFQHLWQRLSESLAYPIRLHRCVDTVRPIPGRERRQVELLHEGRRIDELFDHVVIACPLDRMEDHPIARLPGSPLAGIDHPLSRVLRERYSPFAATEVYSAVWRASDWPQHAASRCHLPAATAGEPGSLLTIRRFGQVGGRSVGQACAYAMPDDPPVADRERIAEHPRRVRRNRDQVIADMRGIVGLDEIQIVHERLWRHNVRYSREQIEEGLPAFIDAAQGARNVWYTGGALSHWNVDAITDFNRRLALRIAKRIGIPPWVRARLLRPDDLLKVL